MNDELSRRQFLTLSAAAASCALATSALSGCAALPKVAPSAATAKSIDPVRIGFVGVGSRGADLLNLLLKIQAVQIKAVCDKVESKAARARTIVTQTGQPAPAVYAKGDTDYKRLCQTEDLDLVITATPWELHVPVCLEAMNAGKHAATEVPAAVTIDECWQLVETSEKTGLCCVMLENCCYGRTEMMALNMVRCGLLGEIIHAECGYLHDLRAMKFGDSYQDRWRLQHSIARNGNLYTTHGLGPVAQCMNIDRGDRFDFLVSMSSKSRGLNFYAADRFGHDSPDAARTYALGDVNSTLIRTVNGCTIILTHNCDSPRPYSRVNLVQGTKGIVAGYPEPPQIYIEHKSPKPHYWQPLEDYAAEYEHPLWKAQRTQAEGAGHGGMDHMELYRLIQALRTATPLDTDVYDAASWSAISELTERSTKNKSRPVDCPDFTRGNWKSRQPLGIVTA